MSEYDAALVLLSMRDSNENLSSSYASQYTQAQTPISQGHNNNNGPNTSSIDIHYKETNSLSTKGMLNSPANSPPMKLGHGFSPVKPTAMLFTTANGSAALASTHPQHLGSPSFGMMTSSNLDRYHYPSNARSGIVSPTPLSPEPHRPAQLAGFNKYDKFDNFGNNFDKVPKPENHEHEHGHNHGFSTARNRDLSPDSQHTILPLSPTSPNTNTNTGTDGTGHANDNRNISSNLTKRIAPNIAPRHNQRGRSTSPIQKSVSHHKYTLKTTPHRASEPVPMPYPRGGTRHIINVISSGAKKPFACDDCGRAFARREHLYRHVETMHNGQKDFKCQVCDRVFSRKDNMMQHVRNKHTKKASSSSGKMSP